jgi:hypothetical protein
MSKKTLELPSEKKRYHYPSRFGSHKSMLNDYQTELLNQPGKIVLSDEYGDYVTTPDRLDDGLGDPARYATSRLGSLFEKSKDRKDK